MVVVDSSAWIEFLRGTGSAVDREVQALIRADAIMVCDPIRMEILAGARDDAHRDMLGRLLLRARLLPTESTHYDQAARLYRVCRHQGVTIRKMLDCLIGSVALDADMAVLHSDRDFDLLAQHTQLQSHL